MTKSELRRVTAQAKNEAREALQVIWDNTNKGQRNKMLKTPEIKEILDLYGVSYDS